MKNNLFTLNISTEISKHRDLKITIFVKNTSNDTLYINPSIMWSPLALKHQLKITGPSTFICDKQKYLSISDMLQVPSLATLHHSSFIEHGCIKENMVPGNYSLTYIADIIYCKNSYFQHCNFENLEASSMFLLGENSDGSVT